LVTAAKLSIDTFNQAASQRLSFRRRKRRSMRSPAPTSLAPELERLQTHRDFEFAREEGDSNVFDLPHFLPPPRRDN
jgi:hypothetical protein